MRSNQRLKSLFNFVAVAAAVMALLPASSPAAPPPGIPDGWSDGYVYANGIRIHYYRATPNPGKRVMVMVHGVTDNGLCWTTLTWKLQDAYDIYMLDTRGHGLTDPFTSADNGDTLVKDVVEFLRVMKFEKPILMGHSMGAATVMRIGAEYPDLANAVIMLDPGLGRGGPGRGPGSRPPQSSGSGTNAVTSLGERRTETQTAQSSSPPRSQEATNPAPDRLRVNMFGSPESLVAQNNYSFDDLVATCRRQNSRWDLVDCQYWALSKKQYHGAYSGEMFGVMSGTMRTGESLAKISVPALILKADGSAEARKANEEAAKVMQKGKLVHLEGTGHNLHHDDLPRTVKEVKDFLSGI